MKLNIAHLYPELLNLYGDRGNIISLKKRIRWLMKLILKILIYCLSAVVQTASSFWYAKSWVKLKTGSKNMLRTTGL